ncbi:MAG: hypothetical protein K2X48_02510 [Chitinophagaceae bacterium]|nr:hypothetical protein [Chitinophagaceae bacterium]
MLRYILIILGIYFLYRFIFDFLLPVSKAAGEMKNRMKEFQEQMNTRNYKTQPQQPTKEDTKPKSGDYIEFEEVK